MRKWFFILCCFFLTACDDFPRDPDNTLQKIKMEKLLHVGLIHNPPWVDIQSTSPTGIEIKFITSFADSLNVTTQWHVVSMEEGVHMLGEGQLHLLAGGLLKSIPYKKSGYTRPYVATYPPHRKKQEHVLAVQSGENKFLAVLEKFLNQRQEDIKSEMPYAVGS